MIFNRVRITSQQLAAKILEVANCHVCHQVKDVMHTVRVDGEWRRYCDGCCPPKHRPKVDPAAVAILTSGSP